MTYRGGKNGDGVYQTIINQIPPHDLYVEAFAGSGAILIRKRPAYASIAIDADEHVCAQLRELAVPGLEVICGDAVTLLESIIAGSGVAGSATFVYADPPYLFSVRASERPIYDHEFGDEVQHRQLLRLLRSLDCMVMISGYWSALYEQELTGWWTVSYSAITRSGSRAVEWLWMNYCGPDWLHDYQYLGANFREREKIKRRIGRWCRRLAAMPRLERLAMLAAMREEWE